jgi:hypothetical protein
MISGRDLLKKIWMEQGEDLPEYSYDDMKISGHSLKRGIRLYQMGIDKFLGNSIIKRLEKTRFRSNNGIRARLKPGRLPGSGEWIDLAGLIVPRQEVESLLDNIENGEIRSLEEISDTFKDMHSSYYDWEWTWSAERLEEETGVRMDEFTADDVIDVVKRWKESVLELDNMLYEDARKEFALSSMTGYGIDGGDEVKYLDFEQVRGVFESDPVIIAIREHIERKSALGDDLIGRMNLLT